MNEHNISLQYSAHLQIITSSVKSFHIIPANYCCIVYGLNRTQTGHTLAEGCKYTVSPQKTCDYIFYNNFNNKCPITIIFGVDSSKSMSHRNLVSFPTSPI